MREKKTVYYSDEMTDDFAGTEIETRQVGEGYPFVRKNPLWSVAEAIMYRGVATPLVFLIGKIVYGLRIKNRRVVRRLKKTGFYLYGNHTQSFMDAALPTLIAFPRKAYIAANPDAVSIKGVVTLVQMFGGIPIPTSLKALPKFRRALSYRVGQGRAVALYPESHIWPWYTGIRSFGDAAFEYPVRDGAPCVAFTTTFRRRKVFKNGKPLITVTLSDPFLPDPSLPKQEARRRLRDEVYSFMCDTVSDPGNYEYIKYIRTGS